MDAFSQIPQWFLGLLLGILGSVIAAWVWELRVRPWLQRGPLRLVLNLNERKRVVFVFPTRPPKDKTRLHPDVAWEDMRAVDYVQRLLSKMHWRPAGIAMRGIEPRGVKAETIPEHDHFLDADKTENVIILCSPLTNTVAHQALTELRREFGLDWDITKVGARRQIMFDNHPWVEPRSSEGGPEDQRVDYALLVKCSLPMWSTDSKIILLAGLRAFGTWGAAWYLFHQLDKSWPSLRLGRESNEARELIDGASGSDFGVVLEVICQRWRIIGVRAASKFIKI